jgi:hypothetical protein
MGHLVLISEGKPWETKAQKRLAELLPSNWIVTTNITEAVFDADHEVDCLVVCPIGIFVIDLKSHGGTITPRLTEPWPGLKYDKPKEKYPFAQIRKEVFAVKNLLEGEAPDDDWWPKGVIVFSNPDAVLDWVGSDCKSRARTEVCRIEDVEKHIGMIAQETRSRPDARQAKIILKAVSAQNLPSHLKFIDENWPDRPAEPNRSRDRRQEKVRTEPPAGSRGATDPGKDDRSIESELGRMFSSWPAAPGSAPEITAEARSIPQYAPAISSQRETKEREGLSGAWYPVAGYSIGLVISVCVALYAVFKLTSCDKACQHVKSARAERQHLAALPQPPPPLPPHSNVNQTCDGSIHERIERPGRSRKFPSNAPRSDSMGDQYTNPCAVYFEILEGVMAFGTDYGFGVNGWEERTGRTQWPVHIDLVAASNGPARWRYIVCRQWHPIMKEWKCR